MKVGGSLRSFGEKSSIAVAGAIIEGELILGLTCRSHTERIDVIPEDISVMGYTVNNHHYPLKVYSPDEYMVKERNVQEWALGLQAVSGVLAAQGAGQSTSTISGSYGGTSFFAQTRTKDGAAVANELARQKEELQQNAENYAHINTTTESRLLKAHTVFNEQIVDGIVIVKLSRRSYDSYYKFIITVPWVEEEPHQITLVTGEQPRTRQQQKQQQKATIAGIVTFLVIGSILAFMVAAVSS